MTVPESLRVNAERVHQYRRVLQPVDDLDEVGKIREYIVSNGDAARHGWDNADTGRAVMEWHLGARWVRAGARRYRLSDSLAALFRLTSAPGVDVARLPHDAFLVEVPAKFLPLPTPNSVPVETSWLLVGSTLVDRQTQERRMVVVAISHWDCLGTLVFPTDGPREDDVFRRLDRSATGAHEAQMSYRFVGNLLAFLDALPASERTDTLPSTTSAPPLVLKPPADVVVTRELREAAAHAASARDLAGVRRAMAHFVRGHWRNQPVGAGRQEVRRTWIRPHKRGDEALGRVVERITTINRSS